MINAGERLVVNNCNFGYLSHRIVFYLLNLHIKSRHNYFVRVSQLEEAHGPRLTPFRREQLEKRILTKRMLICRHKERTMP